MFQYFLMIVVPIVIVGGIFLVAYLARRFATRHHPQPDVRKWWQGPGGWDRRPVTYCALAGIALGFVAPFIVAFAFMYSHLQINGPDWFFSVPNQEDRVLMSLYVAFGIACWGGLFALPVFTAFGAIWGLLRMRKNRKQSIPD